MFSTIARKDHKDNNTSTQNLANVLCSSCQKFTWLKPSERLKRVEPKIHKLIYYTTETRGQITENDSPPLVDINLE